MNAHTFDPPLYAALPFALLLLAIAVLPLKAHRWWENNTNKLILALVLGLPTATYLSYNGAGMAVIHSLREYASFIILIASLYIISGGIVLRGDLQATPRINTTFLAIGAVCASIMGTTGAAMLLIRPVLRTNQERTHVVHTVVFFIFIVANIGGLLTPLGDPPLFLGYLRGVPFTWTFQLWPAWLFMNSALLIIYYIIDTIMHRREKPRDIKADATHIKKLSFAGAHNFAYLAGIVCAVAFLNERFIGEYVTLWPREIAMLFLTVLSLATTRKALRRENKFTFAPIREVAFLFLGVFLTMIPALIYLEKHGAELSLTKAWQFFWATGILSSILDNAPTYLTFSALAASLTATSAQHLNQLIDYVGPIHGALLLKAISVGAVFMGANTYIGNGPNFMVKAIAEEMKIKMPSFFGYMLWSGGILIPLFIAVTWLFFL